MKQTGKFWGFRSFWPRVDNCNSLFFYHHYLIKPSTRHHRIGFFDYPSDSDPEIILNATNVTNLKGCSFEGIGPTLTIVKF